MRISDTLTNSEWFLACLCGLLLAPMVWIIVIAIDVVMEGLAR